MMILAYLRMKFSSLKMNSDRLASRPGSFSAAMRLWATAAATLASWEALTVRRWTTPVLAGSALLKTCDPSAPGRSTAAASSPSIAPLISEFIAHGRHCPLYSSTALTCSTRSADDYGTGSSCTAATVFPVSRPPVTHYYVSSSCTDRRRQTGAASWKPERAPDDTADAITMLDWSGNPAGAVASRLGPLPSPYAAAALSSTRRVAAPQQQQQQQQQQRQR